jgi:hypothetical protein
MSATKRVTSGDYNIQVIDPAYGYVTSASGNLSILSGNLNVNTMGNINLSPNLTTDGSGNYLNATNFQGNLNVTGNLNISTDIHAHYGYFTSIITANNYSSNFITVDSLLTSGSTPFQGNSGLAVDRGNQPNASVYWSEIGTYPRAWVFSNGTPSGTSLAVTAGNVLIQNDNTYGTNPPTIANYTSVTATGQISTGGQTGIYINASTGNTGELTTAVAARKFALIFG